MTALLPSLTDPVGYLILGQITDSTAANFQECYLQSFLQFSVILKANI